MFFSNWDYVFWGVVIPAFIVIVLLVVATIISRKLVLKKYPLVCALFPLVAYLIGFLAAIFIFADGFIYPFSIALQHDLQTRITNGQISAITNAHPVPIYYDSTNRSFHPAVFITVAGEDYYALCCTAKVGDQITLEWTANERIVKSISIYSADDSKHSTSDLIPTTKKGDSGVLGKIIQNLSAILFVCVIVLQYPLGKRMASFFQNKDCKFDQRTIPNRYGLLHFGLVTIPFFGILIGAGMNGFGGAFLIAFIGGIIFISIILIKQTTTVCVCNGTLIYKNIFVTKAFPVQEIKTVYWRRSSIPYNRCLIIKLQSGLVLDLEQEHNWGLQNIYDTLQDKTGDGSLSSEIPPNTEL